MALIYIVEDDESIREIETIALKNSGHMVGAGPLCRFPGSGCIAAGFAPGYGLTGRKGPAGPPRACPNLQ